MCSVQGVTNVSYIQTVLYKKSQSNVYIMQAVLYKESQTNVENIQSDFF